MSKLTVLFKWPESTGFNLNIDGDFVSDDQGRQVTIFTGDSRPCKKRRRQLLLDGIYVIDNSPVTKIFVLVDPGEFPVDQDRDGWQDWLATLSRDIREGWRPVVDHDPWALIPTGIKLADERGFKLSINATGQQAGASLSQVNSPGGYYEGLLSGKSLVVFCFMETGDGPDRQIQDVFIGDRKSVV